MEKNNIKMGENEQFVVHVLEIITHMREMLESEIDTILYIYSMSGEGHASFCSISTINFLSTATNQERQKSLKNIADDIGLKYDYHPFDEMIEKMDYVEQMKNRYLDQKDSLHTKNPISKLVADDIVVFYFDYKKTNKAVLEQLKLFFDKFNSINF